MRIEKRFSETGPDQVQYEYGRDVTTTVAIVEAIASIENIDVEELGHEKGVILHDHIETDAIDSLTSGGQEIYLHVNIAEYSIEIHPERRITVTKMGES